MNNPKTIEAIKQAVGKITTASEWWRSDITAEGASNLLAGAKEVLQEALNSLQEPTSDEHPLHAGYVLIDGQKRELRREKSNGSCPFCVNPQVWECNAYVFNEAGKLWLAPPAPVVEPELDEFEKCLVDEMPEDSGHSDYNKGARDAYMWCQMKYREIKSAKENNDE